MQQRYRPNDRRGFLLVRPPIPPGSIPFAIRSPILSQTPFISSNTSPRSETRTIGIPRPPPDSPWLPGCPISLPSSGEIEPEEFECGNFVPHNYQEPHTPHTPSQFSAATSFDIPLESPINGASSTFFEDSSIQNGEDVQSEQEPTQNQNKKGRSKKEDWNEGQVLALVAAKRKEWDGIMNGGPQKRSRTKKERWQAIAFYLNELGYTRSSAACISKWGKWDQLYADYKKIRDYKPTSGNVEYWYADASERRERKLPILFSRRVFNEMDSWLASSRAVEPGDFIADFSTCKMAGLQDDEDEPIEVGKQAGSDNQSSKLVAETTTGKKRQRLPKGTEGLMEKMQKGQAELFEKLQETTRESTSSILQANAERFSQIIEVTKQIQNHMGDIAGSLKYLCEKE